MVKPVSTPVTGTTTPAGGIATTAEAKPATKPPTPPVSDILVDPALNVPGLRVSTVRRTIGEAVGAAAGDAIASHFPLDDLNKIETEDRWAAGFRLDGGQVRLMWVTARRIRSHDDKPGFELFFFNHGKAVDQLQQRLKDAGAKTGKMEFHNAAVIRDEGDDKSQLKRTTAKWSPSSGSGLVLEEADKFRVETCTTSPEALKGAVRITVFGEPANATQLLQKVVNDLGLQSVFAPPTPASLERYKLMRMLWQLAPDSIEGLTYRGLDDFDKNAINTAIEGAGLQDHADIKALADVQLTDEANTKRLNVARLLYETNPKVFVDWVKADSSGKLGVLAGPGTNPDSQLDTHLKKAGIDKESDVFKAALAAPADPIALSKVLRLGVFIKRKPTEAKAFLQRDIDDVKPARMKAAIAATGIPADRIDGLRFEEVYPGYFTVIDPGLVDQCYEAGARYLYSTADNAERVWQMLSGGQKSSFTRFQEGILIKGKSSDRDFETGGAFSVFSRLVTESVVKKAKAGSSSSDHQFHDWGGSRPYKLIINRRILGRLDWYGNNGDSYGRTTNLTAANRSDNIIKTINTSFQRNNEVMFPVGNDPAFIDFVVCKTEQQKTQLITELEKKGITDFNGKPLAQFVRVETKLFRHPMDMTVEQAVRDALDSMSFTAMEQAVDKVVQEGGGVAATAAAIEAAKAKATETAGDAAAALAQEAIKRALRKPTIDFLKSAKNSGTFAPLESAITAAFTASGTEAAQTEATAAVLGASFSKVEQAIRTQVKKTADEAIKKAISAPAKEAKDKAYDEAAPGTGTYNLQTAVRKAVTEAVTDMATKAGVDAVREHGAAIAAEKIESILATDAMYRAKTAARNAGQDASIKATKTDEATLITKPLVDQLLATLADKAIQEASTSITNGVYSRIKSMVRDYAKATAQNAAIEATTEAALTAAKDAAQEAITATATQAIAAFCEQQGLDVDGDAKAELLAKAIDAAMASVEDKTRARVEAAAAKLATTAIQPATPGDPNPIEAAIKETTGSLAETLAPELGPKLLADVVNAEIESTLSTLARDLTASLSEGIATTASQDAAKKHAQELLEKGFEDAAKSIGESFATSVVLTEAAAQSRTIKQSKPKP